MQFAGLCARPECAAAWNAALAHDWMSSDESESAGLRLVYEIVAQADSTGSGGLRPGFQVHLPTASLPRLLHSTAWMGLSPP